MRSQGVRRRHDERGAALILAIAFLVVVGGIGGAVLSTITSGVNDGTVLNQVRNREYAADGGVEAAIAQVRSRMTNNQALSPCVTVTQTLDAVPIQVDCTYAPARTTSGFFQRNVIFAARCPSVQPPACPNTNTIVRAQVDFASPSILTDPSITVTRTYVQSWSVNG